MEKLMIKKAKVLFFNNKDEGFGRNIVIEVTEELYPLIVDFYKRNNVGNEKTEIGVPNIKEYEGRFQLGIKITDYTKYAVVGGLETGTIGYGCIVSVCIKTFEYNNKFTRGKTYVGVSASAIVVTAWPTTSADDDVNELLNVLNESESNN